MNNCCTNCANRVTLTSIGSEIVVQYCKNLSEILHAFYTDCSGFECKYLLSIQLPPPMENGEMRYICAMEGSTDIIHEEYPCDKCRYEK